jgi:Holliday junction resolvasome RuvABC ATP-dependent DNA helicase subunit
MATPATKVAPGTDHEWAIARIVDRLSISGKLDPTAPIEGVITVVPFTISQSEYEFLANYVQWRLTVPCIRTFVGQSALWADVRRRMFLASQTGEPIPHLLLCGPPEMGKAAFAKAIAGEMGVRAYAAPSAIVKRLDYIGFMSNIQHNDIVIIEEISVWKPDITEMLAEALSDRRMDIEIGAGPGARTVTMELHPFTLVATTARLWQIPHSLRRWFVTLNFEPYSSDEVAEILSQIGVEEELSIDPDAAILLAQHCQGTPGNALALLRRIKGHYKALASQSITVDTARRLLDLLGYRSADDANIPLVDRLQVMDGLEFEQYIAGLFRRQGYTTELTACSGDHGVDILIRRADQEGAVQCKRWTAPVGESVVRDFLGSITGEGLKVGYIAATGGFTEQAKKFAYANRIQLLDLDAIIQMATTEDRLF